MELATRVAAAAGEVVLRRSGAALTLRAKSAPTDYVTDADLASETLIRELLLAARPADGIVGEELPPVKGSSGLTWIVDPLDGTLNFLCRRPEWAVSIAAEVCGRPSAGVVYAPQLGLTYTAARDRGAWMNGQRLGGPRRKRLSEAIVGTGFCYLPDGRARQAATLARLLPIVADVRIAGAASLDLCAAADGTLDAYCESGLAHYDYAAGVLIAAEAGLSVLLPARGGDWLAVAPESILSPLTEVVATADRAQASRMSSGLENWRRAHRWTHHRRGRRARPA
jgi:myo-inositol-1(or 4)-monophosphatase